MYYFYLCGICFVLSLATGLTKETGDAVTHSFLAELRTDIPEPDNVAQENAVAFLSEFFAINKDNRYEYINASEFNEYLAHFEPFVTEECLQMMVKSRIPSKYDRILSEKITSVEAENISLKHYNDLTYEYSADIKFASEDMVYSTGITGQITFDEQFKVDNIYVRETKEFIDCLQGDTGMT